MQDKGYEFIDTFEKRENLERLIKRVEALHKEKAREKKKKRGQSIFRRLRARANNSKNFKLNECTHAHHTPMAIKKCVI